MKHLVDKTILVPFREELKYAVCIVSGRRSPAFRQGRAGQGRASIASGYTPAAVPGRSPDPLWTACGPKGREKKKPPMFGPMSRCVPSFGRGQQPCTPDGLGLVSGICGGRKKKQDKRRGSQAIPAWDTTARSAGGSRGRKLTLFRRGRNLLDADFWKRTGKASGCGIYCDACS